MKIRLDCLYNLVSENHPIGYDQEADTGTYEPYKLFVLETRLLPYIYSLFSSHSLIKEKSDLNMSFNTEYHENVNKRIYQLNIDFSTISNITEEEQKKRLERLQEKKEELENKIRAKIAEITSVNVDYALIDKGELYDSIYYEPNVITQNNVNEDQIESVHHRNNLNLDKKIPYNWYVKVLEYTGLNSSYNPFITDEGIYLTFNPVSAYKLAYYQVCQFLINTVKDYYKRGVIILNDLIGNQAKIDFVKNWNLTPIDEEEENVRIFETKWFDNRFVRDGDKVEFLLQKLQGDNFLYFWTPDNLVIRHQIARSLQSQGKGMIVEGSYIKTEVNNLKEAQVVASLYEAALLKIPIGRVLPIAAARLSELLLYFQYAKEKFGKFIKDGEDINCVSYHVDNIVNPYMFSFFLPNEVQADADALRREFKSFALKRLVDVAKITKLKNMSPHAIIEQEFS